MSSYESRPISRPPVPGALIVFLLLTCLACLGLLVWLWWPSGSGLNPNAQPRPVTVRGSLSELEQANIKIYKESSPCLVYVTNLTEQSNLFGLSDVQPKGVGSGFVWDQHGHIVTNYHVVKGGNAAQVTLSDHSSYPAKQIWAYPEKDIAVVWINAPKSKLRPIPVGTSHDLQVGQIVYALGDPFGLDQTMTTGIVSALGRNIEAGEGPPIKGAIQTSAAINPGNSGGPLLDSAGRLIGMNTAILSPSGGFAGIGLAIPVDDINQVVPQLIRHGKVIRPRLGVELAVGRQAENLGVEKGALILQVVPGGPAAKAGLKGVQHTKGGHIQMGDVIVALDGKPIKDAQDLRSALDAYKVGDEVTLTIIRDGKEQDVKVTLGAAE